MNSKGSATGTLVWDGQSVPFSAKFNYDGTADAHPRLIRGIPALGMTLQLNSADQSVNGIVSNSDFTAESIGDHNVFGASNKATNFEGRYTLAIPGTDDPNLGPFGTSYGAVKVSSSGVVTLAGSLADGTAISQSSMVSQDGYWPLYVNLYGGKGSLWGWVLITNQTITAPAGLSWIKATNSAMKTVYHSGFTNQQATLTGGAFTLEQPWPLELAVSLEEINGSLNPRGLTLKTNVATGVISGSFIDPANAGHTVKVNGVVLQGQRNAQGYFLEPDQSGLFMLEPYTQTPLKSRLGTKVTMPNRSIDSSVGIFKIINGKSDPATLEGVK